MRTFLAIIILVSLAACQSSPPQTSTVPPTETAQQQCEKAAEAMYPNDTDFNEMLMGNTAGLVLGLTPRKIAVKHCMDEANRQGALRVALDRVVAQCRAQLADRGLDPIRDKVALYDLDAQTFAMRTDTAFVSTAEKPSIQLWDQKRHQCVALAEPVLASLPPQIAAVLKAEVQATDELIDDLYLGRVTYGQFAEHRERIRAELQTALANIQQALASQDQQALFRAQELANQTIADFKAAEPVNCRAVGPTTRCN